MKELRMGRGVQHGGRESACSMMVIKVMGFMLADARERPGQLDGSATV